MNIATNNNLPKSIYAALSMPCSGNITKRQGLPPCLEGGIMILFVFVDTSFVSNNKINITPSNILKCKEHS